MHSIPYLHQPLSCANARNEPPPQGQAPENIPAPAPQPTNNRWSDIDGTRITLFSQVEQVIEGTQHKALPCRLHQYGQVVGRGLDSLYVRFADNALVSLPPHVLRLLPNDHGQC
ncbi:MAG: hypothetical protein ACRDQI_14390 [Pseudonocardiaceae bacterium]